MGSSLHIPAIDFKPRAVVQRGDVRMMSVHLLKKMALQGLSENTLIAYQSDLEQFAGFVIQRGVDHVQLISKETVQDFVDSLADGEYLVASTIRRKMASVRRLFKHAVHRNLIKESADPTRDVELPRQWGNRKKGLIAPETKEILRLIDSIPFTPLGIRDRAVFRLMFDAALRVSALCNLDVYDKTEPPKYCVTPNGAVNYLCKGGGIEQSVCSKETIMIIDQWLAIRSRYCKGDGNPALFLTRCGTRMSRMGVAANLKKYGRAVGMPKIHCHALRHRRIGDVMDSTDIHLANYIAGHKHISTTINLYGHQNLDRMRKRIRENCALEINEATPPYPLGI